MIFWDLLGQKKNADFAVYKVVIRNFGGSLSRQHHFEFKVLEQDHFLGGPLGRHYQGETFEILWNIY